MDQAAPTPVMRWALAGSKARVPREERLGQRSAYLNGLVAYACMFVVVVFFLPLFWLHTVL